MSIEEKEKEKDKSIYNYNMIFNKIGTNNNEEDIKLNTNLISDIDLRNFDPRRYEYYTNLLKIYNEDPDTLFNLLNKYNSIKYTKEEEKKLIRQIYDYAVKYTKAIEDEAEPPPSTSGIVDPAAKGLVVNTVISGGKIFSGGVGEGVEGVEDDKSEPKKTKPELAKIASKLANNVNTMNSTTRYIQREVEQTKAEKEINNRTPIEKLIEALRSKIKKEIYMKNPNKVGDIVTDFVDKEEESASYSSANKEKEKKKKEEQKEKETPEGEKGVLDEREGTLSGRIKPGGPLPPSPQPETKGEEKLLLEAIELSMKVLESNETSTVAPVKELPNIPPPPPLETPKLPEKPTKEKDGVVEESLNLIQKIVKNDEKLTPIEDILKRSLKLMDEITDNNDDATMIGGGEVDKYSDDLLKKQYLDTKRYNNIDSKKMNDYRTQQKSRNNNIVTLETSNKIEQLSNDIDVYNNNIFKNKDDDKYIIQQIRNFENDPKNPIEELALTFDDRIVFIIATFFIRYITIIMVQWCIDINIIKTFYEGFIYYAIIYILIFWFIVLFVNIDNTYDVKYMNFNGLINSIRTLFYYFYMGTNGISRLLIHTSLIIILIIIPIILNIKSKTEFKEDDQNDAVVILSYEERKQLSKSLSLFTMFIWLFTSIIATKF
jgi:hypothetical protein